MQPGPRIIRRHSDRCPALARSCSIPAPVLDVPGSIDLGDLMAMAGYVPDQAQPGVPGSLDRLRHQPLGGCGLRPLQQPGIRCGRGGHLQVRDQPPARVAQRGGMGVQMGVEPDDQASRGRPGRCWQHQNMSGQRYASRRSGCQVRLLCGGVAITSAVCERRRPRTRRRMLVKGEQTR